MKASNAYWGFPISADLHDSARQTMQKIKESQSDHKQLSSEAAAIVSELTQHGLSNYYHKPTEIVPIPSMAKKAADTGIKAIMKGLDLVIRQFFKKRSQEELQAISSYLELMLHSHPESGHYFLVFSLNDELYGRAQVLIDRVRADSQRDVYIRDVVAALCDLVAEGVKYYYYEPTRMVDFKGIGQKTADVSIGQVQKGIQNLIKKLVSELTHDQLVELSHHIESMLHASEDLEKAS